MPKSSGGILVPRPAEALAKAQREQARLKAQLAAQAKAQEEQALHRTLLTAKLRVAERDERLALQAQIGALAADAGLLQVPLETLRQAFRNLAAQLTSQAPV